MTATLHACLGAAGVYELLLVIFTGQRLQAATVNLTSTKQQVRGSRSKWVLGKTGSENSLPSHCLCALSTYLMLMRNNNNIYACPTFSLQALLHQLQVALQPGQGNRGFTKSLNCLLNVGQWDLHCFFTSVAIEWDIAPWCCSAWDPLVHWNDQILWWRPDWSEEASAETIICRIEASLVSYIQYSQQCVSQIKETFCFHSVLLKDIAHIWTNMLHAHSILDPVHVHLHSFFITAFVEALLCFLEYYCHLYIKWNSVKPLAGCMHVHPCAYEWINTAL